MSENRYIQVAYQMLTNTAASHKLLYESTRERPDDFVSGMGLMIDAFEQNLLALAPGESFDFTLQAKDAFGERNEEAVVTLPRSAFEIDGKFDDEHIYPEAEVPLMNSDGDHFPGIVTQVTSTEVTVDLNNPLAGKTLQFKGEVLENREPTLQELERAAKLLSGECGGCGGCGGDGCGGCGGQCG